MRQTGKQPENPPPNPTPNPNGNEVSLGIDIGGTRIKSVALQMPDRILAEYRIDSNAKQGPEAVRKSIQNSVEHYRAMGIGFSRIGLGCAGSVCPESGVVLNSPNFADWSNVPLRQWIEADFGKPTSLHNDANCAMFTEWKLGGARGADNALLLTFGTGIGGGLILGRRLYTGSTGSAGELGHFSINPDGIQCSCGNTGCFERYCSGSALESQLPGYSSKEIFAQAKAGSGPYQQNIGKFLSDLKIALVSLANIFDPDVILIGGGLSPGLADYLPEIRTWVQLHAFPAVGKKVKIVGTQYGNQSGAIGAALLGFELEL